MGFGSYVRQFLAAFWCLLRPSLPWCFPDPSKLQDQEQQPEQEQKGPEKLPEVSVSVGV